MTDTLPIWNADEATEVSIVPLRSPSSALAPEIPALGHADVDRRFATARRDGRLPRILPSGRWTPARNVVLKPIEVASWITPFEKDRVLAFGPAAWVEVGQRGVVARGLAGGNEHVVDAQQHSFYVPGRAGEITARSTVDAKTVFAMIPTFGRGFEPIFIARHGRRLLTVGLQRPAVGHHERPSLEAVIDVYVLTDPIEVDDQGLLASGGAGRLILPTGRIAVAALDGALFVAMPNELVEFDFELHPRRILSGEFVPLSLSVAPGPRLHLLAEARGRRYYWVISSKGERVISVSLPIGAGRELAPPILFDDGGAALLLTDRLLRVNGAGRVGWELQVGRGLPDRPVGATCTADGQLLVSAGAEVLAVDSDGHARRLVAGTERLTSAPIVDGLGLLWVAGLTGLLAFSAAP